MFDLKGEEMAPIEYLPIIQAFYRSHHQIDYPLYVPRGNPWTSFSKPLRECKVALVCSAGIYHRDQTPFAFRGHDDLSIREIPKHTSQADLVVHYGYFDQADAEADINCLFPLGRLQELEEAEFIGGLCSTAYSMGIGRWLDPESPKKLEGEVAEDLAERCKKQGADAVLLVPG